MFAEKISFWIEKITANQESSSLLAGRKEYQKLSGEIFQDDKSYESRMGAFLEWYTFQKQITGMGKPPLFTFLEQEGSGLPEEDRALLESLTHSIHSLFILNKIRANSVVVRELFDNKQYEVKEGNRNLPFSKNDLFEGRLVPFNGDFFFTGTYSYHPPETGKFIHRKIRELQEKEKSLRKQYATLEKQLKELNKQLSSNSTKQEKLRAKIEKTEKPEKRAKLVQELGQYETEGRELESKHLELVQTMDTFRQEQLEEAIPKHRFDLIQRLSYMSLKWERSRQIDIHDIYHD